MSRKLQNKDQILGFYISNNESGVKTFLFSNVEPSTAIGKRAIKLMEELKSNAGLLINVADVLEMNNKLYVDLDGAEKILSTPVEDIPITLSTFAGFFDGVGPVCFGPEYKDEDTGIYPFKKLFEFYVADLGKIKEANLKTFYNHGKHYIEFTPAAELFKEHTKVVKEEVKEEQDIGQFVQVVKPKKKLASLLHNESTKKQLERIVMKIMAMENDPVYKEHMINTNQTVQTRCLFYGPPGTGKTSLAEAIANEIGKDLWICNLAQINSKYVGDAEKNLQFVMEAAQRANVVLLLDEVDSLLADRNSDKIASHQISLINTGLTLINNYVGVLVAATNSTKRMDEAMARRFDFPVNIPLLDKETMPKVAKLYLEKMPLAPFKIEDAFINIQEISGANIEGAIKKSFDRAYFETVGKQITLEILKEELEMRVQVQDQFAS